MSTPRESRNAPDKTATMGNSDSKPSASTLRWQYTRVIRDFLSAAERFARGSSSESTFTTAINTTLHTTPLPESDELPRLLHFTRTHLSHKTRLERDLAGLDTRLRAADARNTTLAADLADVQSALRREMDARRAGEERAEAARREVEAQHRSAVDNLAAAHAQQMQDARRDHERRLRVQAAKSNEVLAARDREVKKLQGQLLVSHDKNLAWPDEKLKIRLGEVRRVVDNATARLAAAGVVPRAQVLNARLDPGGTVGRCQGKGHFWLRARVWDILQAAFFGLPFGFGAFGPEGVREVMAVYAAWRARLDGVTDLDPSNTTTFAIFRTSPLSNKWRSVTFQSLALGTPGENAGTVARIGEANITTTAQRILTLIADLAAFTQAALYPDLESEIRSMVRLTFEIAVQFGINQAGLSLLAATSGEMVVIGAEFHDCEDGEEHRGTRTHVDFVVSPGLVRVGDGREEMARRRTVLACEVFAAEE
ncbi:hypothetical protein B0T25DRAFT_572439 [Lasiosphaeria hispida]|uniref:Uncharacterized protein n=1 Tax=Lasiosphaeria hispida TaxID=260671 RepID=A0AAJ0M924_9PEZI|nr:hypothetical protein B0T25DRAFT_572439 [Lasiosphaeria hispida]